MAAAQGQQNPGVSTGFKWPDMYFGPVNLWSLPPAWYFYLSSREKQELADAAKHGEFH